MMNDPVMDVCDACLGDGEFVEWDGDSVPCSMCDGTGYVMRDADQCDLDYIQDCGDQFAASSQGERDE